MCSLEMEKLGAKRHSFYYIDINYRNQMCKRGCKLFDKKRNKCSLDRRPSYCAEKGLKNKEE